MVVVSILSVRYYSISMSILDPIQWIRYGTDSKYRNVLSLCRAMTVVEMYNLVEVNSDCKLVVEGGGPVGSKVRQQEAS